LESNAVYGFWATYIPITKEVAKQMVRNGFRVFPEQKTKKALQQGTPDIKKDATSL